MDVINNICVLLGAQGDIVDKAVKNLEAEINRLNEASPHAPVFCSFLLLAAVI